MDLSFIGDQLGNFADFAGGLKDIFVGFASVFDTFASFADPSYKVEPTTTGFEALSSK